MNAVGIDVSKGKSTVAILRPLGEVVSSPFNVGHTNRELKELADYLKRIPGETRVVMEYTGKYYQPMARFLHHAGIFVSVVHAMLIHDYGGNSIRRVKTDKKDALKIAAYGLDQWIHLTQFSPEEDTRLILKTLNRQYSQYAKLKVALKNNLISLMNQTFPGINTLFSGIPRQTDGHEKWIDFVAKFWHCDCIATLSETVFGERYRRWCQKTGYRATASKVKEIYELAHSHTAILPKNEFVQQLISQAVGQLNTIMEAMAYIISKMNELASCLPEYPIVMSMYGVGKTLGPQLIAEIGDIRRLPSGTSVDEPGTPSLQRLATEPEPHIQTARGYPMQCGGVPSEQRWRAMSYLEAKEDGIRIGTQNGQTMYYPRCQFCGQEVRSLSYLRKNQYTCPTCRPFKALFKKLKQKI